MLQANLPLMGPIPPLPNRDSPLSHFPLVPGQRCRYPGRKWLVAQEGACGRRMGHCWQTQKLSQQFWGTERSPELSPLSSQCCLVPHKAPGIPGSPATVYALLCPCTAQQCP